jgi:hypothetical protein
MWPEPWQEIQEFLSESEVSEPDLHRWIPYMRPRAMHPGDLQELVEQYRNMTATSCWATQLDLIPGWGESSAAFGKMPWISMDQYLEKYHGNPTYQPTYDSCDPPSTSKLFPDIAIPKKINK